MNMDMEGTYLCKTNTKQWLFVSVLCSSAGTQRNQSQRPCVPFAATLRWCLSSRKNRETTSSVRPLFIAMLREGRRRDHCFFEFLGTITAAGFVGAASASTPYAAAPTATTTPHYRPPRRVLRVLDATTRVVPVSRATAGARKAHPLVVGK